MSFDGEVLSEDIMNTTALPSTARKLKEVPVAKLVENRRDAFLVLSLEHDGETVHSEHFFTEYKRCNLADATIAINVDVQEDDGTIGVTVSSDKPAFFVSLNADGIAGEFDDNCFVLLPGEPRDLVFTPKEDIDEETFTAALTINHLRATYS
jgi:beta-mannosidase